jgi:saccharopine dehydrogenase-like NADP-dependent oxidoreductase
MNFLIHELHLNADRKQLEDILKNAKPVVQDDVVIAYAVVEGWKNGELRRSEFSKSYSPVVINGHTWRAISWTTAASIVAVIEMVLMDGCLKKALSNRKKSLYWTFLRQDVEPFLNKD